MSISLSSTKVFPSNGLDADETAQIAKLGAIIAPVFNQKPTFRSSVSKKGRMDSVKSNNSDPSRKYMSSFLSANSELDDDDGVSLEIVINFLTSNIDNMLKDRMYQKEFEELCHEMLKNSRDPELHRILKSHGWTGTRYKDTSTQPLDMHALLQDLSNLYLRYKVSVYTTHITNLYESGNEKATDQIFSFVPDSLLAYLSQQKDNALGPRAITPRKSPKADSLTRGGSAFPFDPSGRPDAVPPTANGTITADAGGSNQDNDGTATAAQTTTESSQGDKSAPSSSPSAPRDRASVAHPKHPTSGMSASSTSSTAAGSASNSLNLSAEAAALAAAEVRSITFTGACMLADISGFSKFSGAMCLKGVSGLDELREATNGFLGHIVKTVYEFNGDVIAFAGDALICVFLDHDEPPASLSLSQSQDSPAAVASSPSPSKTRPPDKDKDKDNSRVNCCYRALQCANVLRHHKTKDLSAHIGVSYGEMKMALLGGLNDQWVYLMNGQCVSELAACIESAGSQEIAATRECYAQAILFEPPEEEENDEDLNAPAYKSLTAGMKKNVNRKIDLTVLDERSVNSHEDGEKKQLIRILPVADPRIVLVDYIDPRTFHLEPTNYFRRTDSNLNAKVKSSRQIQFVRVGEEKDQQKVIENAALFVPRPILSAIYSEALDHIGELRHVTTAFISLDSYDSQKNSDPATLQPFFLFAQRVLQESGGFLRQFLVDDKGCVFIAMWGMPSFTYSNNASRALYCAVAISMGVKALGHEVSIGITTGNVFCGTVGAPERRDYAGIGTDVNMAARLMSKAHGRVLVDMKTYHNLNEKTRKLLTPAEEMKLKGNDVPVTPYQYSASHVPTIEGAEDHHDHAILRRPVKTLLGIQIDKITNSNSVATTGTDASRKHSYFTLVIGPPGTGKSTAVEYFRHSARKRNIPCFFIKARPGHEGVPYGLMRELFLEMVGEHNFIGEEQQRSVLMTLIEQAYAAKPVDEKRKAMFSLEIVMGVEWGKSNRKVGSFSTVVADAINSSKKAKMLSEDGGLGGSTSGKGAFSALQEITEENPHEDSVMPLPSDKHTTSGFDNLLIDSSMTHFRAPGDMAFYNILNVLLRNRRVAIIIEDAHFCDELSWTELALILSGRELEVSVLLTMRSNNIKAAQVQMPTHSFAVSPHAHSYGSFSYMSGDGVVAGGPNSQVRPSGQRNSVLVNAISNSVSVSRSSMDASAMGNNSPKPLIPSSPHGMGTLRAVSGDAAEGASRYGLKNQTSGALMSILSHERATVIEMTGLAETEVREVLLHTLKVAHVSHSLVKLVFDVSSGNAYWCKAIAHFIKERGVKELEDAIQKGDSPHQALKVLILMRMEKLEVDHQLVLKNAAIIGDEFSERMLQHVLPARIQAQIPESLDLLAEHGFIFCVEEFPETIFAFQNELIRETLYELMPPRDSAHLHLLIAQFIEKEYAGNLRPFYPMLGQHYLKSLGHRNLAFKYELKAADQAISRGAFSDGLVFVEAATKLAVTKPDLKVISDVINRALRDIAPISNAKIAQSMRKLNHKSFAGGTTDAANSKIAAYMELQAGVQARLDKFAKNGPSNVLGSKTDARLTWQPSYVASKMSENSESDDDTPPTKTRNGAEDPCCTIS